MKIRRHIAIGVALALVILCGCWIYLHDFQLAAFYTSIVIAQMIAIDSLLFILRYRKVQWKDSLWGRHVMRLCLLIGITFQATVIINILFIFDWFNGYLVGTLTVLLYGAIAAEMHNRRYLQDRAQMERRMKVR